MIQQILAQAGGADPMISGNWLIQVIGAIVGGGAAWLAKGKLEEGKRQRMKIDEPVPEVPIRKNYTPPTWDAHRAVCERVSRLEQSFEDLRREQASQYKDMMQATNGLESRIGGKLDGIAREIHHRIDEIFKPKPPVR